MGRPSKLTPAVARTICERLANGESLRAICTSPGLPPFQTVHRWVLDDEAFRERYVRAREVQAANHADEILEVGRKLEERDANGIAAGRGLIEALKWRASRINPGTWGDRVAHEVTGADGKPLEIDVRGSLAEKIRSIATRSKGEPAS